MSFQLLSRHGTNGTRDPWRRLRRATDDRGRARQHDPEAGPASSTPEARRRRRAIVRDRGRRVWLFVKAIDDPRRFAVVTLNGITLAALYFVVASGFTLIFGLMRVVNMAHGSLYLLGGYLALEMQDAWFKEETGSGLGLSLSGETRHDLLAARLDHPAAARDRRSSA